MNATNLIRGRRLGLLILVAVLGTPLALTTSASAGHNDNNSVRFGWGGWNGGWNIRFNGSRDRGWNRGWNRGSNRHDDGWNRRGGRHDHGPHVHKPPAFKRGVALARKDGQRNGYWDGYAGKRFCDEPKRDLCERPKPFVKGYMKTYSSAYCAGYEAGKRARRYERRRNICW
jgi:hypothetical protein